VGDPLFQETFRLWIHPVGDDGPALRIAAENLEVGYVTYSYD
jgi:hypothetical protein